MKKEKRTRGREGEGGRERSDVMIKEGKEGQRSAGTTRKAKSRRGVSAKCVALQRATL